MGVPMKHHTGRQANDSDVMRLGFFCLKCCCHLGSSAPFTLKEFIEPILPELFL